MVLVTVASLTKREVPASQRTDITLHSQAFIPPFTAGGLLLASPPWSEGVSLFGKTGMTRTIQG